MVIVRTPTSPKSGKKPFEILYNLPPGTTMVVCIGGRGGMKTYEVSKFIAYSATKCNKRCVVLRDEKSRIKQSILNEIHLRYDTANVNGRLDMEFNKQEGGIQNKATKQDMVFTMGFRASSNIKQAGLKSVSDVDIAVIEEAEDIRDVTKFNNFNDSIRKEGYLTIVILNTPDLGHWILERYFNVEQVVNEDGTEEDGYWNIIPKQIEGFVCIQTGYEDNQFLPKTKVKEYQDYGRPDSHTYDKFHYMTSIKGYASSGRKGQVFPKSRIITLEEYMAIPEREIYGQDFGEASPAGIVGVKLHREAVYSRELNYEPMDILEIAIFYCKLQLSDSDIIIADSAKPMDVQRLRTGWTAEELDPAVLELYPQLLKGFNCYGVAKPPGSLQSSISLLKSCSLYLVGTNFAKERINYIYAQDKNGKYTNEPVDEWNHLWDPTRYVKMSHGRYF